MIHQRAHGAIWGSPTGQAVVLCVALVLPIVIIALGFEPRVIWMLSSAILGVGIIVRAQRAAHAGLVSGHTYAPLIRGTALTVSGAMVIACPVSRWSVFAPLVYAFGSVIFVWLAGARRRASRLA